MHEIQRKIIHNLRYNPGSKFADLSIKSVDSNKLSYHLSELVKSKLIENKNSRYYLTKEGKKLLNFLTDKTAKTRKQPVCVVGLIPVKEDKTLVQKRLKEPWYGYWLLIAGKIEFGESFKQAVDRELLEETDLKGNSKFIGMVSSRSYDKDELTYHVHMYCYRITNLKGELAKDVKEGKNRWLSDEEISKNKMHPLDYFIYKKRNEEGWLLEQEEYFDGEKLLKTKVKPLE
ncbi:MAG: ADP-ribose pyrophosphatase [Candidatus Woesearchaeota archaeon]|nr:ADP-ribose pyrophosphatase [Candidatus Woesearchaeota archaeon]